VPGPCDPEDLLDGVIFGAKYLGSTQIKSDKNPSTNARMKQAQEAVDRIKIQIPLLWHQLCFCLFQAPEGESQPMTEVDLFISTQRIKVLTADTQVPFLAAWNKLIKMYQIVLNFLYYIIRKRKGQDSDSASNSSSSSSSGPQKKCLMICHVFFSDDVSYFHQRGSLDRKINQTAVARFQKRTSILFPQLHHFDSSVVLSCRTLSCQQVVITKAAGEILGLAVVESGWGSILPTVVVANLLHGGPAERCGELSIGDRIMSVNGTSLVGLPITTCQNVIRGGLVFIQLCKAVMFALIVNISIVLRLSPCQENVINTCIMASMIPALNSFIMCNALKLSYNFVVICEAVVKHSVALCCISSRSGQIHLKTMPASTYRLLTGQEQPVFL
uniref:Amyloid beta precursor protein binding family A member 3 n=1 Tax=Gasterosteus aculeatus TaxID=69293 RepID=G3P0L9_GASAC